MKEVRDNTSREGGPTYAARSLPQYNSAFATRVLLSTYVCVKGERAWARNFKLLWIPGINSDWFRKHLSSLGTLAWDGLQWGKSFFTFKINTWSKITSLNAFFFLNLFETVLYHRIKLQKKGWECIDCSKIPALENFMCLYGTISLTPRGLNLCQIVKT